MTDTNPAATVPVIHQHEQIGVVEAVQVHGVQHWRYITAGGYRSPYNHIRKGDAIDALIANHQGRDTTRLEPVDGADGVDGHDPMFEVYRCPPGCPQHPPVVVCGKDKQTWPCGPVQAVCAELDHIAAMLRTDAPTGDEAWQDCAALLATRSRSLATASGAVQ